MAPAIHTSNPLYVVERAPFKLTDFEILFFRIPLPVDLGTTQNTRLSLQVHRSESVDGLCD